jgi:hypothetical protein
VIKASPRAGHTHVHRLIVQLAWRWVDYQPDRALTQRCARKFGHAQLAVLRHKTVATLRRDHSFERVLRRRPAFRLTEAGWLTSTAAHEP